MAESAENSSIEDLPATQNNLASMTGFARADGQNDGWCWSIEVKSLNAKAMDLRCRVPQGFEMLEAEARKQVAGLFKRGTIHMNVTIIRHATTGRYRINRELLEEVMRMADEMEAFGAEKPRFDAMLSVRGVIEEMDDAPVQGREDDADRKALVEGVSATMAEALKNMAAMRRLEGAKMYTVLTEKLDEINTLTQSAENLAAMRPAQVEERMRTQVNDLLEAVDTDNISEERLHQELALLLVKGDVREELDRLKAHIEALSDMLDEDEPVGRRMDFLCQELHREANTLCSKSGDVELTRIGLSLKAAIDQLREQVQNIE